jgi:hypothetical protein
VTNLQAVIAQTIPSTLAVLAATVAFAKDPAPPTAAGLWERADSSGAPARRGSGFWTAAASIRARW